jgi:hypothetical protein
MRILMMLAACTVLAACDIQLNMADPSPPSSPTGPSSTNITNTNTNTNTVDRSDTGPSTGGGGTPSPPSGGALPLPVYGEAVLRDFAAANPALVQQSCQTTFGEAAWAFLDQVIDRLQDRDARWGYLCKDATCSRVGHDVIAYRASSGDTGIWIVDVLGNHCPGPSDSPTSARWGVLPFDTARRWIGLRP